MRLPVQYVEFFAQGVVTLQAGEITTDDPAPWEVVVQNEATLISPGTEPAGLTGLEPGAKYPAVRATRRSAAWSPRARPWTTSPSATASSTPAATPRPSGFYVVRTINGAAVSGAGRERARGRGVRLPGRDRHDRA